MGTGQPARLHVKESYGKFPLRFEANQGQTDSRVKFLARVGGYNLFLTSGEAVLAFSKGAGGQSVVRAKLHNANTEAEIHGVGQLASHTNYFIGDDPTQWHVNIPNYEKVYYRGIYPGIDLVYYGNQAQLEYDFIIAPGADPAAVRFQIKGARRLRVNARGDLLISSGAGEVRLLKPVIYQEAGGAREVVKGRYVLSGKNMIGFEVAAYDRKRPLVIDPVVEYATFLGGSNDDRGLGIAVDAQGNAYVAGLTTSLNFPTANPHQPALSGASDAFVAKLDADGSSVLWSTYFGGSGTEQARGIALDPQGNAYITGVTDSNNLPTVNAFQATKGSGGVVTDAFVAKLSADGASLVYSTYLGGWRPETGDAIAVDTTGKAYVTGNTGSNVNANVSLRPFPTTPGAFQTNFTGGNSASFVTRLSAAGNALDYSTFIGGLGNNAGSSFGDINPDDLALGIAVDSAGDAIITGRTESEKFPVLNAVQPNPGGGLSDAFVTKLNATGTGLIFSTFLGGGGEENRNVGAIALDPDDNIYLTGATNSTDFPILDAIQPAYGGNPENEAFVTKFDASGARVYSTYLGGSNFKRGFGIATDTVSNVYVTGTNLLRKISADGASLVYSQTLGGEGRAVALDAQGGIYVTGLTTTMTNAAKCTPNNFCPTANAAQPNPGGGVRDAFVIKLASDNRAPVADAGLDQTVQAVAGTTPVMLDGSASSDPDGDPLTYQWKDANGNVVGSAAQVAVALGLGTHAFTLTVNEGRGGTDSDTASITVEDTLPPVLNLPGNITAIATIPAGATVEYAATATDNHDGALTPVCSPASPHLFPLGSHLVVCTATDSSGNTTSGSFQVTVVAANSASKNVYIDFERYPGSDGVYGTGDTGEGCTVDGQDIGDKYAGMGVNFRLTDGRTPVINQPAYEYIPGSPRTLRPMNYDEYQASPGNQNFLKDFDILFDPGKEARRVKLTALNADEDWWLIGYNASGVEIIRKKRDAGSDRSVRSLEIQTDGAQGFIRRVRVNICNGSDSCGGEGPESFDLLEFEPPLPPVFSNTRFIDFEKHPGSDGILGTADDTDTTVNQSIAGDYHNLGVTFQLRDGTAPVIRDDSSYDYPSASPRTLYPVSAPSGGQTQMQDLIIHFTTPVSRVKLAAIDADEAWDVKVYSTSGALIRSIHRPSQGNGIVFVETHVDPCSAVGNLIARVEIIPTKSSECCHSGPEFYDLLEFDVVNLVSPPTIAARSPHRRRPDLLVSRQLKRPVRRLASMTAQT